MVPSRGGKWVYWGKARGSFVEMIVISYLLIVVSITHVNALVKTLKIRVVEIVIQGSWDQGSWFW